MYSKLRYRKWSSGEFAESLEHYGSEVLDTSSVSLVLYLFADA
jgi:hypothetical protein